MHNQSLCNNFGHTAGLLIRLMGLVIVLLHVQKSGACTEIVIRGGVGEGGTGIEVEVNMANLKKKFKKKIYTYISQKIKFRGEEGLLPPP